MKTRYTWIGSSGLTLATAIPTLSGGADIAGPLQALSQANLTLVTNFASSVGPNSPGASGAFSSLSDIALLNFLAASGGGTLRVQIPAPVDALFMGDGETVDPSALTAFIDALQTFGLMPDGLTNIGPYDYGYRRKLTERKY